VKLTRRAPIAFVMPVQASSLMLEFTLKQIADHLGHRSLDTTRIYTKIDLRGLVKWLSSTWERCYELNDIIADYITQQRSLGSAIRARQLLSRLLEDRSATFQFG